MTAGHDGEVTVRDAATAAPVRSFSVRRSRRPDPPPRGLEPPEVWAVVVALSSDGSRAAAVTIEGTVYVWDVATGKQLFDHADREAGGPPPGSLRFGRDGGLLAPMGDRYGMRRIDLSRKASRPLTAGPKAYQTVAITDDATAFAVVTPSASEGRLSYAVEVSADRRGHEACSELRERACGAGAAGLDPRRTHAAVQQQAPALALSWVRTPRDSVIRPLPRRAR